MIQLDMFEYFWIGSDKFEYDQIGSDRTGFFLVTSDKKNQVTHLLIYTVANV